ncbi:MAG: hypothetical protein RLP14_08105 [Owenweeksia sp.]
MDFLNNESIVGFMTAIILILIGGAITYFSQYSLKKYDNLIAQKKKRENKKTQFYIPLLRNLYDIDDRFKRIISNLHKDWLDKTNLSLIKENKGFAEDPTRKGYFIISSIYLIGSFFGIYVAIKKSSDLSSLLKKKNWLFLKYVRFSLWTRRAFRLKQNKTIFQFEPEINKICRLFQFEELFQHYMSSRKMTNPTDSCKLHKHIQNSVGEMMLIKQKGSHFRIKSFREFYSQYTTDEKFRFWFVLIENMFNDLSNFQQGKTLETQVELKNDIRPLRILAIQYWCRVLMGNIASELELANQNYETRPAEKVLDGLSEELKQIIKNYKLQTKDMFISGLNI